MLLLGISLLIIDCRQAFTKMDGTIERNSYGEGNKREELEAEIEGITEREPIQVDVSERRYKSAEIRELFSQAMKKMDAWILGENKSLDRIEYNMELIQNIPGQPIDVEWELDRYDIMNVYGELWQDALREEGDIVQMKAILSYREAPEEQAMYQCTAMVYKRMPTGSEKTAEEVKAAIRKLDEETVTEKNLKLPSSVRDKRVSYYKRMDKRGAVILVMAVLIAFLLYAMEKQNEYKRRQEKQKQMLLDYPELINKFTLLLGAGMTVRNVWRKMVSDYENQKEEWGERYAYEEMKVTWNEMHSGITEAESYERFGRRCKVQEYVKFGALLSQNLRKGTKGLAKMLKSDALQAFEERKVRARRLGEEAGTKLLLPMFLMLSVALVIVIVPAFLTMQM